MEIYKLEQTRAIQILIYVAKHEEVIIKDLLDHVGGSYNTINRAMEALIELNLIEDSFSVGKPSKRYVRILDKGKKAANVLLKLEEIIH